MQALNRKPAQALIFAPHGRDAAIAQALLREAGIDSGTCPDFPTFLATLGETVSFVVVTEEALQFCDLESVARKLKDQPAWSDLPIVVLTQRGGGSESSPVAARLADVLGNVTFLERPFRPATIVSVARSAFKARQRQYEARARIEELHEGEERLRTALTAGRLGSWELDLPDRALVASESCSAVLGLEPGSPLSYDDLLAAVHVDDRARVEAAFSATMERGGDLAIEYRSVRDGGAVHWAELRARLVRAGNGSSRLVGVASDITDRKERESLLRQINETLEQRVSERTAQLERAHAAVLAEIEQRRRAEEFLRQSQKMEMMGQLTGGVAHDFNNVLTVVINNLEMLRKRQSDDAKSSRLAEGALQGARRGAALTQRLLAFARQQTLQIEPRNLQDLIRGMTDLIERSIGPQIELRLEFPPTPPVAQVDANQIELAVLNLVVNARDAMPGGGVLTISVSEAEARTDDDLAAGRYVRLAVSDTGHGMSAETLARAVDPFFSTKEVGKGTGLGLSMVHGLAVQLKGALRLSSEVNRGTRAELWLPAGKADKATAPTGATEKAREETEKIRILVVDDDALIARSTTDMLGDLGHSVIEANSGDQALGILESNKEIDLLITDFSMPGMNGVELGRAARKVRPDLAVVLVTGYAELLGLSEPSFPRINKPYFQSQLAAEITKALRSRG